jgi:hypothetical protein
MTRATVLVLLGAALLLAACGGGGGGGTWQTFDASEGGFRVSMPGKPTKGRDVLTTAAGPLEGVNYVYTTPDQRVAYGIDYVDYPAEVVRRNDPERILEAARDGLVGKLRGRVRDERRVSLEGRPGRAVDLALADGRFVRARLSLVGQRQYQLVVVTPDERTAANDAERFLESFRLLR